GPIGRTCRLSGFNSRSMKTPSRTNTLLSASVAAAPGQSQAAALIASRNGKAGRTVACPPPNGGTSPRHPNPADATGQTQLGFRPLNGATQQSSECVPPEANIWSAAGKLMGLQSQVPPLARLERNASLPLSFAQERLWWLEQSDPGAPYYNVP